jgi:hypothetical protein
MTAGSKSISMVVANICLKDPIGTSWRRGESENERGRGCEKEKKKEKMTDK